MSNDYKVNEIYLETIPYKLLIFHIPETDINDKLTYFSREKGLIAKSLFDDFLIANCVSNINQFLQHLSQKGTTMEELSAMREEIIDKILELNPKLIPSNLVINVNHVLKLKAGDLLENEMILGDNEFWNKDLYYKNPSIEDKSLDKSKSRNIKDLKYTTLQKFWRRIGQYVLIKQFEPGSELVLLTNRSFDSKAAFEQYVVTMCIEDIEELFSRLDRTGLPDRVQPAILIHELYELCRASNTFLDFNMYKDSHGMLDEEPKSVDPLGSFQKIAETRSDEMTAALKRSQAKLFRDVGKDTLLSLDKQINKKVVGQSDAIKTLVDSIQRASVGLRDPEHPIGAFIFTGPTGIGKTYTAKILAEELTGARQNMISIDCSEYSADHEYAKLIGAPSGYIGHEQGGQLTNAVKKNPFSIVLFDEIEKASEKVHQLLLQIMDEARLTDGKGKKVSFKDVILIMTSNLGVKEVASIYKTIGFGNANEMTDGKRVDAVKASLKKKFKPEFLNRITDMVNFGTLAKKDYTKIIKLELSKLKRNLKINRTPYSKLSVVFHRSLYDYIYKIGIDDEYGARPLNRAIESEISTPLAKKILSENINCDESKVTVSVKKGKINIDVECTTEICDPPSYMEMGEGDLE